jgi:hypothetical protein
MYKHYKQFPPKVCALLKELFNTDTGECVSSPRHPRHRGKIREGEGGQVAAIYPSQATPAGVQCKHPSGVAVAIWKGSG